MSRIGPKAKAELVLTPEYWAAQVADQVPWCEPEVLLSWMKEWLRIIYLDARSDFERGEPSAGALGARLELKLRVRLKGEQTTHWLQGHTAELQAKRENDAIRETRFRPTAEDYEKLQIGHIPSGKGDSKKPPGDAE